MGLSTGALFGRSAALRQLQAALDAAAEGHGQIALVSGDAGIGKSALVDAIAREAEARGARVVRGRAWEFADAPPFFPLWPCFRALGVELGTSAASAQQEDARFRLWEEVTSALARESAQATSVWILEDLHAADLGSLDLLGFLAQTLRALRALVVCTARSQDARLTQRALQRLTRISLDGLDVRLEALSDLDVAALVEQTLGRAVPVSTVRRIVELTEGNPLFAIECAKAFSATGGVEGAAWSLPPTLRHVVMERIGWLPGSTRAALAAGAILGREFTAATVARMTESLPARVIDVLLPALRSGLISESNPGGFVFSHALVRDAIEASLEPSERAPLHERAETALAALGEDVDVLVERTRHALSSLPFGSVDRALGLVRRATALLEGEGAFDRAFELQVRLGELERAGLLPLRAAVDKLRAAELARAAGRGEARRALCEDVLRAARATRDGALLARAALLHGADVRPNVIEHAQVALYEEARRALGESQPELICRVLARLATALQPTLDQSRPSALAREALARARATGDAAALLDVLELSFWGLYAAPPSERLQLAGELLERAQIATDVPRVLVAHGWLAAFALEAGDFAQFNLQAEAMLARSDELGHPRHRWRPLLLASARATLYGHFAESDRYVTEVRQLMALVDDPALPHALATYDLFRKRDQRRDEQLPDAIARFEGTLDGVWEANLLRASVRAACAARVGDVASVRVALASLGVGAVRVENAAMLAPLLAEAAALAGDDERRRRFRDTLGTREAAEISGLMPWLYEGPVERLIGLLDASLGDVSDAEARLRRARDQALSRGHRPLAAQTAYELSQLLERQGQIEEARALLEDCGALARELGMRGLEAIACVAPARRPDVGLRAELRRAGDIWTLSLGTERASVKDSRGVELLSRLIARPGEEIHVLALASDQGASLDESHAGELLDERAESAYRERLLLLGVELAEAERLGQRARAERLARERDALEAELRRAVGLGGRARRAGSATQRARVSVQKRVKEAIARFSEASPALGRFLGQSVTTGTFCCFRPKT